MADSKTTLIQGVYGSERVPVPEISDPTQVQPSTVQQDGPRVLVNDTTVAGQPGFEQGHLSRAAREVAPEATVLESVGGAIMGWDTTRMLQRIARPSFDDDDPNFDIYGFKSGLSFVPTPDEDEYITKVGKGKSSAEFAVQQVLDRRTAAKAVGDHPIVGFATSFVDPLWLAVPPAVRLGKASPVAGRVVAGVSGAALAGGVTAAGEGPVSDEEIALSMLMNGAAGALVYKPGQGLVQADPTFPAKALAAPIDATLNKPRYRMIDGQWQEVKQPLPAGAAAPINTQAAKVVADVDANLEKASKARGLGEKLQWNMRKTMSDFGPVGKKVADTLFDNNSDLGLTSMEAHREAIRSDLLTHQFKYEDALRRAMGSQGAGLLQMVNPFKSRDAYRTQARIERDVQRELFRREQYTRDGRPFADPSVPAHITEMADELDGLHKRALKEMQAAGVDGAENLLERPGYLNRKWSSLAVDQMLDRLEAMGLTRENALKKVHGLVGLSVRRVNGLDQDLADKIGKSIVDRALRKGYFEDSLFNAPAGEGQLKELRDILKGGGMNAQDIERALDVLRVATDDAGKASFMKHRMDVDYKATLRVGTEDFSVMDLIDSRVTTIVDQYIQRVSTSAAFARKGLKKRSDIEAMREELLHSVGPEQRAQARDLFDNVMAYMRGDPSGGAVNDKFRLMQSYGRSIALAWSGLWQLTEYANAMGEYGLRKSLKYAAQEIPGFKQMMNPSAADARSLANVLADHSSQSMRLRPYIARFEDGFEMDTSSALQLSAQTAGQMVPYANAMRYVHHSQAKMVGNLIVDRLDQAARGNTAAREALAKYGLESPVMDKVAEQIKLHGLTVDSWDDAVWMAARPAFAKMMDASVLSGRMGDIPAFAAFDPVGKFLFTYRSFVLVAHNKVLAGGLARNGAGAVGLVMMYQFPLALAAVQAQSVVRGEGTLSEGDMVKKALGQMGGLGLFSEPLKWATGESNSIGAPGLIPVDRAVKLLQSGLTLDAQNGASTALTMLPVVSAVPFINGMAHMTKE